MVTGRYLEVLSLLKSLCYLAVNLGITLMSLENLNCFEHYKIKPEKLLLIIDLQLFCFSF